jgi:plastocyanin
MSSRNSNTGWYIAAIVSIVVIIVVGVISYEITLPTPAPNASPTPTPTSSASTTPSVSPTTTPSSSASPTPTSSGTSTALTIYGGMVSSSVYGFGNSANDIISPGPTLNLKVGTTYTMTFYNAATDLPHSWEISSSKAITSSPLFGAGIAIDSYVPPGGSGTVTFTPDQAGNFYYVCTVPGHIALGMWGNVVVTS